MIWIDVKQLFVWKTKLLIHESEGNFFHVSRVLNEKEEEVELISSVECKVGF